MDDRQNLLIYRLIRTINQPPPSCAEIANQAGAIFFRPSLGASAVAIVGCFKLATATSPDRCSFELPRGCSLSRIVMPPYTCSAEARMAAISARSSRRWLIASAE